MNLPTMTRRELSARLAAAAVAAGVPIGRGKNPPKTPPPVEPAPVPDRKSWVFMFGGRPSHIRYVADAGDSPNPTGNIPEHDGPGMFRIEPVDVSGWPENPHPDDVRPVKVIVNDAPTGEKHLWRHWRAEDTPRCGLCKIGCNAWETSKPGIKVCAATIPSGVVVDDPAMFRDDYPHAMSEKLKPAQG